MIELIGVYQIDKHPNVHLIEVKVKAPYDQFDIGDFTQRQNDVDELDWQTPWDEKFLNTIGTEIIGDSFEPPKSSIPSSRVIFYFHFLDFGQSLITPFGDISLKKSGQLPERLSSIIRYEKPD